MFAIVESGSITSMPKGNKGVQIGDLKYPAAIFTIWSEAERNAIGVYTPEIDDTNLKNREYYDNTSITYAYDSSSNKVKGTYGSATAKSLVDINFTADDESKGYGKEGDLKIKGLKNIKKDRLDEQCRSLLAPSDWMYIKAGEEGVSMDSGWKTCN